MPGISEVWHSKQLQRVKCIANLQTWLVNINETYAVSSQGILFVVDQMDDLDAWPGSSTSDVEEGEDCSWQCNHPHVAPQLQTL